MKRICFIMTVCFFQVFVISCSSSDDSTTQEVVSMPSYMRGCKYNDNDYQNYSGSYSYLKCYYQEENGIIKMALYDGGYGSVGNLIDSYYINFNTAQVSGSGYQYFVMSNNIEYEFKFNSSSLDQNEPGYYSRVTVKVDDHIIHFKPFSCSEVEQYIVN